MTSAERLAKAIEYPEETSGSEITLLVDGGDVRVREEGGRIVLERVLCRPEDDSGALARFAGFAAGRLLKEEATLAWDPNREAAILWQDVPASDSGHEAYHAVCKSDRSDPDEWVMRYAFPLAEAASRPLKPGETLYMNATSVFGKEICGERCGIFTVTPYTTCHTTDRIGAIRLAK